MKLVSKRDEAKATKTFFFEPEKPITYLAGQYIEITLNNLGSSDPRGPKRQFTLSSSPSEKLLSITTRIRDDSPFKKALDSLEIGSIVEFSGPFGIFYLNQAEIEKTHVFIAGGIGITPFRSIIRNIADTGLTTSIILLYSNSTPEEIAFRNELEEIKGLYQNITVNMTVTKPNESAESWEDLSGRIDANMITSIVSKDQVSSAEFWVCGPPPMVTAIEEILASLSVSSDRIRIEKFTGY